MHIRMGLLTAVMTVCCRLHAGAAPAGPAPTSFPMAYREGLIWVQVKVSQTSTPLNFLLDTGAGVSVLNRSTAQKLGLHAGNAVAVQGVGTNTVGLWPQPLSAQAGDVALPGNYLALDLDALSGSCTCPVDGIIGADFFQNRVVTLDFDAGRVLLDGSGRTKGSAEVLPLKCRNRAFLVPLAVNGRPNEWFRLDTGCASALQWVTGHQAPADHKTRTAVALSNLSIDETTTSVRLGRTRFDNVITGAHQRSLFTGEAGLLGNGLLSRFASVTIDAKAGRAVLQRTAHSLASAPPTAPSRAQALADTD